MPRFLGLTAVASLMSAAVAFLFGDVGVSAVMAVAAAGIVIVAAAAHCEYPPRATRWGSETDAEMIARSFEDGEPHIADPRRDKLAEELLESFETLDIIAAAAVMHAQAKGHGEHEMEEVVNFIGTLDYDGLGKLRELATEMKGKGGGRRRGGPR
jgi:hypothetical protein